MAMRTRVPLMRKRISRVEIELARRYKTGVKRLRRKKTFSPRIDPFVKYKREDEFMKRFRLPRRIAQGLANEFANSPACTTKGQTNGGGIMIRQKVCYALRYLATGANYSVMRDTQGGCSKSTIGRCISEFVQFLVIKSRSYIKFPEGNDLHQAACEFGRLKKDNRGVGFNKCVGIVDGTYIPIERPVRNEGAYICRKGYHALNCMVVVDAQMRFIAIDVGSPGSQHDSTVWGSSHIAKLVKQGALGGYFLLGDNGYTQSETMMTPFTAPERVNATQAMNDYQHAHTSTRSLVERSIGQLKTRWRCLSRHGTGVLRKTPVDASMVFTACCVLHNICIKYGVTELTKNTNKDPDAELQIRLTAAKRLLKSYKQVRRSGYRQGAPNKTTLRERGVNARNALIRKQFGGLNQVPGRNARPERRQRENNNQRIGDK